MNNKEILDYVYQFFDCRAGSLREYFHQLLSTLWREGEGFSGKRPFGNSGWEYDIYSVLVEMGAVDGKFDFDPDTGEKYGLERVDKQAANKLVPELFKGMCFES